MTDVFRVFQGFQKVMAVYPFKRSWQYILWESYLILLSEVIFATTHNRSLKSFLDECTGLAE
jgi:hypothetical protein